MKKFASAALIALWVVPALWPASAAAQAIPVGSMFRSDPSHTGCYDSPPIPEVKAQLWRFTARHKILSSPAIGDGLLFVGADDKMLYAIDIRAGMARWQFETRGKIESSPAVADHVVYFGSEDKHLYASIPAPASRSGGSRRAAT